MKKGGQILHGHSTRKRVSSTYKAWDHMIQRCTNPNCKAYKNYGGRTQPITVCDRWNPKCGGSFINFLEDMGEKPIGYELDRTNNNLGYYKDNCRWTTKAINNRNKRNSILISFNGKTQCLNDWAKEINISPSVLRTRIYRLKWSIEKALTTPINEKYSHKKKNK